MTPSTVRERSGVACIDTPVKCAVPHLRKRLIALDAIVHAERPIETTGKVKQSQPRGR